MPDPHADPRPFRALIARHFPDLLVTSMAPLPHVGWGGDSDAWLVNGALVFRFPRTPAVAAQLAVEACLLPALTPSLPLRIPDFEYVARDAATSLPIFVGYLAIAGEPMTPALLNERGPADQDASTLASSIAGFLTALHGWPVEQARACGVAEEREPERTYALFDRVRDRVYPLLAPALRAWTDHLFGDALADPRLWDHTPALVHGDLSADHILFDRATRTLAGIIDFGDMAVGDPLGDFVGLAPYGKAFLEAVLAAYARPLGVAARDRLAFYRRRLPFIALAWGAENGDQGALDHGMALLRAVVAAGSGAPGD